MKKMDTMVQTRQTVYPPRFFPLAAGPAAVSEARRLVRAAVCAWDLPADRDTAVLLTSELVTNAITHQAGGTVIVVVTCRGSELRVDVHDTSCGAPEPVAATADSETGRGLLLVASLATDWGFYRTHGGKAVYFTLGF
jgi:anti-sigma regulatory factor (Ser/Thr protein kinase)